MGDETDIFRRDDDRRMERALTLLERIDMRQGAMEITLQAITDGSKQLPQCRENERRLNEFERKINEHSYSDLSRRVTTLEDGRAEQKDFNKKMTLAGVGAGLALIVRHFWDKIIN